MKKLTTLTLGAALAVTALSAHAQIALDGVIGANELGTGAGKYQSLGAFTTPHVAGKGFGLAGLLHLYGANNAGKLYVGIAGTIEPGGNNFQLYMDLPNKTGVPVGTPLPAIATEGTVFGTDPKKPTDNTSGTKLDLEADAVIALTGQGDVQAAIYSATTGQAKSLGGGASISTDGTPNTLSNAETTGDYSLFKGTRVAYTTSTDNSLITNPGNDNGGGAGSNALEYEFDTKALGLPSGASVVKVMVAYVSPDGYWSSDVIPEVTGNGNQNLEFRPDFTALPGTQAAQINAVALSTRQADEAVVALSVFPNPSQGESTIAYQVRGQAQTVSVVVTDLIGRPVQTLLNRQQAGGIQELKVNHSVLAAGTYLVKVQVGDRVATRKLVLN